MMAAQLEKARRPSIVASRTRALALAFDARHNAERDYCAEPSRVARLEESLLRITGERWSIRVELVGPDPPAEVASPLNNCFFQTESTILHDQLRLELVSASGRRIIPPPSHPQDSVTTKEIPQRLRG